MVHAPNLIVASPAHNYEWGNWKFTHMMTIQPCIIWAWSLAQQVDNVISAVVCSSRAATDNCRLASRADDNYTTVLILRIQGNWPFPPLHRLSSPSLHATLLRLSALRSLKSVCLAAWATFRGSTACMSSVVWITVIMTSATCWRGFMTTVCLFVCPLCLWSCEQRD